MFARIKGSIVRHIKQNKLLRYIDQEISEDEHLSIINHLQNCLECQQSLEEVLVAKKTFQENLMHLEPNRIPPKPDIPSIPGPSLGIQKQPQKQVWGFTTAVVGVVCVLLFLTRIQEDIALTPPTVSFQEIVNYELQYRAGSKTDHLELGIYTISYDLSSGEVQVERNSAENLSPIDHNH